MGAPRLGDLLTRMPHSQATVDEDLPDLERAVQALTLSVEKEDPDTRPDTT